MNEVSREEAIKELHNIRPRGWIIPQKRAEAIDKAISDMAKLQKIEEIVNLCNNPCKDCRFFGENGRACIFLKYEEIEKILEES